MKDLKYEHQSGWVVGWLEGGWLECSWGGWVCGGLDGGGVHGGVGGWRVHGVSGWVVGWVVEGSWGGAYNYPPMNSYNVKIFNFMNTHPPTHQTYPKCHSITVHILTPT